MTTSYLECNHLWIGDFSETFAAAFWRCQLCDVRTWRAPWSYCELIGVIGMEALLSSHKGNSLACGQPILTREQFASNLAMFVAAPPDFIRALQAGCRFAIPAVAAPRVAQLAKPRLIQ